MPSNKRALIERWQTGPGLELAQQLKACWLFGREPYPLLPLEKHNGRWDFRGLDVILPLPPVIPLPDGTALDMREYRNAAHGDRPDSFNQRRPFCGLRLLFCLPGRFLVRGVCAG